MAFSDASDFGIGVALYLRSLQTYEWHLLYSKSRLAPSATQHTISRKELIAATLLVTCSVEICKELDLSLSTVSYFTDSLTTLQWIQGNFNDWRVFVRNRTRYITQHSHPSQWKRCSGELNSSDIASRGSSANDLINNSLWLYGPSFLSLPIEQWTKAVISSSNIVCDKSLTLAEKKVDPAVYATQSLPLPFSFSLFSPGKTIRILNILYSWKYGKPSGPIEWNQGGLFYMKYYQSLFHLKTQYQTKYELFVDDFGLY